MGANRGIYVYKLWKLGALVEAFEPNPDCFKVLNSWACGKSGIKLHQLALSNEGGYSNLHIPIDSEGIEHDASASLQPVAFERGRISQVNTSTIDCLGITDVTFMKIDVEGHELQVLQGSLGLLRAHQPVLLIEIEQRHCAYPIDETFGLLSALGYVGFFLDNSKLISLCDFERSVHQHLSNLNSSRGNYINNFIFFPRTKLAEDRIKNVFEKWGI